MLRWLPCFLVFFAAEAAQQVLAADGATKTAATSNALAPRDWPWWRGPGRNGHAAAGEQPPLKWDKTTNIHWQAPIRGRGHGSPIVVGDQVILATADRDAQEQSVICLDRKTGRQLWQTIVHHGGLSTKGNKKASQASSSLACNGDLLFANFLNDGAIYTTALDRSGKQLWQTKIVDYVVHQGYGSSPAIYKNLVIVSADNKGGGAVAGLEQTTGKIAWKVSRPKTPNYASPVIVHAAGKDQVVFTGCNLVTSIAPLSGRRLWETKGATTECVTSTVTDGKHIFTSGGYPKNHVSAVAADGSGKLVWENKTRVYVPSMLIKDGHLYAAADAGFAICWRCKDGQQLWKHRIEGTFTASPVLIGDHILATNERGRTYVFKANPKKFELVGQNQLGDQMYATAAVSRDQIFLRVAHGRSGARRKEVVYCVAKK